MHGMSMIEYKNSNRNRILKAQVVFPCYKIQSQRLQWTSAIPSKLLRSNKKLGLCFGVKYDFMSCVWLSIRSRPQTDAKSKSSGSMLEYTKPKTHTDFEITIKALGRRKKLGQCFVVKND